MGRHRLIAKLAVMNNVFEPADNLDGDFDTTAAAPYLPTGFNSFTGLAAGDYFDGLIVEIPTAGHGLGVVTGEIVLQPKGQVDTGIRAPQDPITLTMSLEIVPGDDGDDGDDGGGGGGGGLCSLGPKSASAWMAGDLWLLLAFISGLGLWRTRRRKDAAK
jgi:hypothetical protein